MAGWATKIGGETADPMAAPPGAFHAYVRREPVGVAAQIVPWNFPMIMATLKIAPGARRRLHDRAEARRADLGDRAAPRRPGRRGRLPGGRDQHHHRPRRDRRRPDGPPSRRRQGRLHRLDRGRQDHQPRRDRQPQAGDARARRQVAGDRPARRRRRRDRGRRRRRDLLQFGPDLRRRLAPVRAPLDLRQADRGRRRPRPASGRRGPSLAARQPIWARSSRTSSRSG